MPQKKGGVACLGRLSEEVVPDDESSRRRQQAHRGGNLLDFARLQGNNRLAMINRHLSLAAW
jgi:hypothetical protein